MNEKEIRALYDDHSITIYQAYNNTIANEVLKHQTFVSSSFKKERMTWLKPSFLWMMYRSGWANKENQERIFAIKIKRHGFEWALQNSCLSHFDSGVHTSYEDWKENLRIYPVRIQWDPEKDIFLRSLTYRSIQVGLSGIAVEQFIFNWIDQIDDITKRCKHIHQLVQDKKINEAKFFLPEEKLYPLPDAIGRIIGSS